MRVVGTRAKRIEDPRLLRGAGRFAPDIALPEMVHAAFVRSPHAHALVRSIDMAAARAMPGVHAVLAARPLARPPVALRARRGPPGHTRPDRPRRAWHAPDQRRSGAPPWARGVAASAPPAEGRAGARGGRQGGGRRRTPACSSSL